MPLDKIGTLLYQIHFTFLENIHKHVKSSKPKKVGAISTNASSENKFKFEKLNVHRSL